ncbi:unnamed protein product [Rangifer tarandus platyrhynchus]|uniref:Uncharacterized protein n=2 Tax=Rangifer tarandus platyrhynchus TaxID=3082113 RepID=A0AC59YKL2_RANTA|nr:unnamed protein product [Rangifer tarandus platyrhynchus]
MSLSAVKCGERPRGKLLQVLLKKARFKKGYSFFTTIRSFNSVLRLFRHSFGCFWKGGCVINYDFSPISKAMNFFFFNFLPVTLMMCVLPVRSCAKKWKYKDNGNTIF